MDILLCCFNFLLAERKIKKKKGEKKFGLTKLSHKTFKVLWHHKLRTLSQVLCDINMWSCWLQGKFTHLLSGESVPAHPASPVAPGPANAAAGFIGLLALAGWLGALRALVISEPKQSVTPTFRHWTWTSWVVSVRFLGLVLAASIAEVLPFLTRSFRQVSCKPVVSTDKELTWQTTNLARKGGKKKSYFSGRSLFWSHS